MTYSSPSNRKKNKMNALNTTKLFGATLTTIGVVVTAAVIVPAAGILAVAGMIGAGLIAMAALETKRRAY